ncbi:MAG: hypothetical protein IKV04_07205 [Alistipes sp.]|nr:hypothetical protein [Alistipes sp.]
MKRAIYIFSLMAAMVAVACSSGDSIIGRNKNSKVVATVDDNELILEDILRDMPEGLTGADSVTFAKMYIDNWVLNHLKLARAEKVLKTQEEVNRLVEGYRQSLIMRQLDQYYLDEELDTEITDEQIKTHYKLYSQQFTIDHDKVKGIVVRVSKDFRNSSSLREALGEASKNGTQEISAMAEKHDLQISDLTSEWVTFSDFLSYLPTERTRNYDKLLTKGKVQSMKADDVTFYFTITDIVEKGSKAPIESVTEDIRRMIYAERRGLIIKRYEEELKREAMEQERIEIDNAEMMHALESRPKITTESIELEDVQENI